MSPEALTVLLPSPSAFARTTEGAFEATPPNTKFVGTLNGAMRIYVDPHAADGTAVLVGYKGSSETDAAAFYRLLRA